MKKILVEGKPKIAECECECKFLYTGEDIIYINDAFGDRYVRCPNCGSMIEVYHNET